MNYQDAIELIKVNPYNIQNVEHHLVDMRLVRFLRRYHSSIGNTAAAAWALEGFTKKFPIPDFLIPKDAKLPSYMTSAKDIRVWLDNVFAFGSTTTEMLDGEEVKIFVPEDIPLDKVDK